VIRFSASLVVVALGLLVVGGVTSKLLLVYAAIAVSAIALVFLIIGGILNRGELRASSAAEAPGDRLEEASTSSPEDTRNPGDNSSPSDSTSPGDTRSPSGISTPEHTNSASDTSSAVDTSGPEDTGGTGGVEDLADTQSADQPVTVVPGEPRYHRSNCILIRFMGDSDLQKMPVGAAKENGCTPCRACHTDGEETG
jgi:hypothetical protein